MTSAIETQVGRLCRQEAPAPAIETLIAAHGAARIEHDARFEDEGADQNALVEAIDTALVAVCAARPVDLVEMNRRRAWLSANLVKETDSCPGLAQRVYDALLGQAPSNILPLLELWREQRRKLDWSSQDDETITSIGAVMGDLENKIVATPARTLEDFAAKLIAHSCFGAYGLDMCDPRGKAIMDEAADVFGISQEERRI